MDTLCPKVEAPDVNMTKEPLTGFCMSFGDNASSAKGSWVLFASHAAVLICMTIEVNMIPGTTHGPATDAVVVDRARRISIFAYVSAMCTTNDDTLVRRRPLDKQISNT